MFEITSQQLAYNVYCVTILTLMDELDKIILCKSQWFEIVQGTLQHVLNHLFHYQCHYSFSFQRAEELAVAMEVRVMMPIKPKNELQTA